MKLYHGSNQIIKTPNLNIMEFNRADIYWLDYVVANRKGAYEI